MNVHPLGAKSVLLAAPADLYLTSLTTLEIFDEVCRRSDILDKIASNVTSSLVQKLYPSCGSAWIEILLHCQPHDSLVPILTGIGLCFDEARRSAGGIAIMNAKKKKANFENDEVLRFDEANAVAYRIFFLYAARLRHEEILRCDAVWRLCTERLVCPDTMQCALASAALLAVTDVSSTQTRAFLALLDDQLEGVFAALNHHLIHVEEANCKWYHLKADLESLLTHNEAIVNAFKTELLRAARVSDEQQLDIALEYYLKDDDRLKKAHSDKMRAEREVSIGDRKLKTIESNLTVAFALVRALSVLGASWLCCLEVGDWSHPPGNPRQRQGRVRIERIYQSIDWDRLYIHSTQEVSMCNGMSAARLLAIGAVRVSPHLQEKLAARWATDAMVELAYKGRKSPVVQDNQVDPNNYNMKLNKIKTPNGLISVNDAHNAQAIGSGFFTKEPSRWYPADEGMGWRKQAANVDNLIQHREMLLYRVPALHARIAAAMCYWASHRNKTCRTHLLRLRTRIGGHTAMLATRNANAEGVDIRKSRMAATEASDSELCWVNIIQLCCEKSVVVEDSLDHYDENTAFQKNAGLLSSPTERVILKGMIGEESEPVLPYPDATIESIGGSVTPASPLFRAASPSFSELLEESAVWASAHDYPVHMVCTKGHCCARLLHASLVIKTHAYLIMSGAEGGAERSGRRCIHPLDVVCSLLNNDPTAKGVSTLHKYFQAHPECIAPVLKSWAVAAGAKRHACDILTRACLLEILSVLLSGPVPAFRSPHSAVPMHAHLRTGPQLSSSLAFYRATSTYQTSNMCNSAAAGEICGMREKPVGLYVSLLDEACACIYAPTPLSMLSLGVPVCQVGTVPGGGFSLFIRSLRFLTAVASIDPVFVRRSMQQGAHEHDAAGSWAAMNPDTPFLVPLFLILQGGAPALIEHLIRLEGEGGGGLHWRNLSPRPSSYIHRAGSSHQTKDTSGDMMSGGDIYGDPSYIHLRQMNYWQMLDMEDLAIRRHVAELLSVLTMGDIGLCHALACAGRVSTGSLLNSLAVRDPMLSQNIFRLCQNVLLSAAVIHGDGASDLASPLFHPSSRMGEGNNHSEIHSPQRQGAGDDEHGSGSISEEAVMAEMMLAVTSAPSTPVVTASRKSLLPTSLLSKSPKLGGTKNIPPSPSISPPAGSPARSGSIPQANKVTRLPPGAMSPKAMRRPEPKIGWSDAFDSTVCVLPEEGHVGPAPRTVIDSTAASLVHLPFTSPIHPFRLAMAQEGDFLYYAYRVIVEASGKYIDDVIEDQCGQASEDRSIADQSYGVLTGQSLSTAQGEEDSLFGIGSIDVAEAHERNRFTGPAGAVDADSPSRPPLLHSGCHPSSECTCQWCLVDVHRAENARLDVLLFATESVTTFCAHRLELQQRMYEVATDVYMYLLTLFPHPPTRMNEVMGEVLLDERTVQFQNGCDDKNMAAEDIQNELLRQNPTLSLDRHIESLMSFDSTVTDLTPAVIGDPNSQGLSPSASVSKEFNKNMHRNMSISRPPLSPLVRRGDRGADAPKEVTATRRISSISLMRPHLGLCGACSLLIQVLLHRHDPIRSAVRQSGLVGGLVRALDVATSCADEGEVPAISRLGSADSISTAAAGKRRNATSSEILDKILAVKVVNAVEVLIIRNVQAWEQIQCEAGVRGLLRLCLVGGPSIRVLSATALMQRISVSPPDPSVADAMSQQDTEDSFDMDDGMSEFGLTASSSIYEGSRDLHSAPIQHSATTSATLTFKSYDMSRATMQSEICPGTHKATVLDDRVRGVDLRRSRKAGSAVAEIDNDPCACARASDTNEEIKAKRSGDLASEAPTESSEERRIREQIEVLDAMRRRQFVDELIDRGCLEAISSMLESPVGTVQTCGLRFLKIILINSSRALREKIIDTNRPEASYYGPDRNNADFVFIGSTGEYVKTYEKFNADEFMPEPFDRSLDRSMTNQSELSTMSSKAPDSNAPFFLSIPRIGKFLYSPELDVVRAAAEVLQVLGSANAGEVRKILKYYQRLEDKEVYAEQVPAYKLGVLNAIKRKAIAFDERVGHNPYHSMKSFSVLDDNDDASQRGRLPSMDSTSSETMRSSTVRQETDQINMHVLASSRPKSPGSLAATLDTVAIPLASRVGYRLLDMTSGRILPVSCTSGEPTWSLREITSSPSSPAAPVQALRGSAHADMCDANKYFPHRMHYLNDPKLMQELDHIARNAGLLAGILTDGEESNYADGCAPLLPTLGRAGAVSKYCEE